MTELDCRRLVFPTITITNLLRFIVMKKEWTDKELRFVMQTIKKWINSRKFVTMHDGQLRHISTIAELDNILGLPYTSSGRAACVGICNTQLYLDDNRKWVVDCFEMDDYNRVYAVCREVKDDWNELFIPIN